MSSKVDKTPSIPSVEEVRKLAERAKTRQTPRKGDLCIGIYHQGGDEFLIYSPIQKMGFCVVEQTYVPRLGYLSEKEVNAFVQKHLKLANKGGGVGESPSEVFDPGSGGDNDATTDTENSNGGGTGDKGTPKVLSRSDLSLSDEAIEKVLGGVKSCRNPRAETLRRDPLFKARAGRYIERGADDPRVEKRAEENRRTILPDGRVVFWKKPVARKVADTLLTSLPSIITWPVSHIYQPKYEMGEEEKKSFLEETFEERAAMAEAFQNTSEEYALAHQEEELEKIWNSDRYSFREKKEIYFNLWDECLESGEGALQIRQSIIAFIRKSIPQGSSESYTREELDGLNAKRTSRARFDPYG